MVNECDTTRVPGRIDRICGRSFMLRPGSRYMVMTVAWLKSVAKMSALRKLALPATPAASALFCDSFTMSGLYSTPSARAPNLRAAWIAILPSPEPRSTTKSLDVTCAIVSMRSTTSSGVGTQMTSLPAWPTCGSNFCCCAATPKHKRRALAARQRHMTGVRPVLHPVDHVGEARAALGQVRRVDLGDVAEAHHLGAGAGAGHQRLHLRRRQVLRLVDDQPLVDEGAAAHEVERLDADARAHQVARRRAAPFAARFFGGIQHIEVVLQCAHPGLHLLLLGARQEADVLAKGHRDARHDDLGVALLVEHLGEARGEGEQRLARTGLAEQGDEVDRRVHQQVEREVLLAVARVDPPHGILGVRVVAQRPVS